MLSAPAHIPAITPNSLRAGFAAPDLIRDVLIDTFSATSCGSWVCSASPSSGTSPACDTRLYEQDRMLLEMSQSNRWPARTWETITAVGWSDAERRLEMM